MELENKILHDVSVENYFVQFMAHVDVYPTTARYPIDLLEIFWNGLLHEIKMQAQSPPIPCTRPIMVPSTHYGESNKEITHRLRSFKDIAIQFEVQLANTNKIVHKGVYPEVQRANVQKGVYPEMQLSNNTTIVHKDSHPRDERSHNTHLEPNSCLPQPTLDNLDHETTRRVSKVPVEQYDALTSTNVFSTNTIQRRATATIASSQLFIDLFEKDEQGSYDRDTDTFPVSITQRKYNLPELQFQMWNRRDPSKEDCCRAFTQLKEQIQDSKDRLFLVQQDRGIRLAQVVQELCVPTDTIATGTYRVRWWNKHNIVAVQFPTAGFGLRYTS